jgi:hypothetical protein
MIIWNGASSEALTLASLLPEEMPEGWALAENPQNYTKKTLFEHLDGQAEIFLKYGFQKSIFAIYYDREKSGNQIELDIYDMGSVLQAFGIFSRFRAEGQAMGIGLDSYLNGQSALFYQGKYFVMLYATESNSSILKKFSINASKKIPDRRPPPREIGYFPKNGLKPGSIRYFPEGLLGHRFLGRGFQGAYIEKVEVQDKDREFNLFFALFKDSKDASHALKAYKDYLSKKGKIRSDPLMRFGPYSFSGEDPYQGQMIVTQSGIYLLGAIGFMKSEQGVDRLIELMEEIKRETGPV